MEKMVKIAEVCGMSESSVDKIADILENAGLFIAYQEAFPDYIDVLIKVDTTK